MQDVGNYAKRLVWREVLDSLLGMFRRRNKTPPDGPAALPADVYLGLRSQIFSVVPSEIGLGSPLWGCVMETGYPHGTATLVCLADGTTSLYTSTGGGIIGGGFHQAVATANAELLHVVNEHVAEMPSSADQSLPAAGKVIIRALTTSGQRRFEDTEAELGTGHSSMSALFYAAHGVITELRLIDEARR
jgi:hypothetical protein